MELKDRTELVHDAVKRLVRTSAINNVLSFYEKTHIHSDMQKYVLNEVKRFNQDSGRAK
ncbi:MAG: hypothetical protein ACI9FJ_002432 [Alteromonadaceae bacterium]|jgi:hypothetical protein